jgi:hypothetical protein
MPRVTRRDHRAIEEALAGATLFNDGARLDGAIVEASYADGHPPLLKRLREDRVPRIVDPQSLRFTGERYLEVEPLRKLPYAPSAPIVAGELTDTAAAKLARGALAFEQEVGCDLYMTPGLGIPDRTFEAALAANQRILECARDANGTGELDRKPLIATIAPGMKALAAPERVIDVLLDVPLEAVYLQPLRLDPIRDSLEKLARLVQFARALDEAGFPVMVGRVGAFGLILQALGIRVFDSGLGQAEAHDLSSLNRRLTERERQRRKESSGAGPAQRVYFEQIKTTVDAKVARVLVADPEIRHRFACKEPCCRFRALEDLESRARPHYLWTRQAEVAKLRSRPIPALRMTWIEAELRSARDTAMLVTRVLEKAEVKPPALGHLDRWLGLLAREQAISVAA